MSDVLLWPNFGAEERTPARLPPHKRLKPLVAAWSFLFPGEPAVEGVEPHAPGWLKTDTPIFPFLADASGLVPWLSTSRTQSIAEERGLAHFGPSPEAARLVGDKAWAHEASVALDLVPEPLAERVHVLAPDELQADRIAEELARWPEDLAMSWTLKPRHGSSGRGRVKGSGRALDTAGANALPRLAEVGGAILEPWCEREADLSAQLFVSDDDVLLLGTQRQHLSASGLYQGNTGYVPGEGEPKAISPLNAKLRDAALLIGERARADGFRGPMGVDSFAFAHGGKTWLRACVEVNARFTTGMIALGVALRAEQAGLVQRPYLWSFRIAKSGTPPPGTRVETVVDGEIALWLNAE